MMKIIKKFTFFTVLVLISTVSLEAKSQKASPALTKALQEVYVYWRNATVKKNYNQWKNITASYRQQTIQNRILSQKGNFPADVFNIPGTPPSLAKLKLLRSRAQGVTAKLTFFGEVDFGVGGTPPDNLLVLSFIHEGKGWKYDTAEFINLAGLKDVRKQLQRGNLSYVNGAAFSPDGKRPIKPIVISRAKHIAKVYAYCPGREVKVRINKISKHRFQDIARSEIVIGGAKDGVNEIYYQIKDLPGYKGTDPLTIRVYLFSQKQAVKPIKVFQYQVEKGVKPKSGGTKRFIVSPQTASKL